MSKIKVLNQLIGKKFEFYNIAELNNVDATDNSYNPTVGMLLPSFLGV